MHHLDEKVARLVKFLFSVNKRLRKLSYPLSYTRNNLINKELLSTDLPKDQWVHVTAYRLVFINKANLSKRWMALLFHCTIIESHFAYYLLCSFKPFKFDRYRYGRHQELSIDREDNIMNLYAFWVLLPPPPTVPPQLLSLYLSRVGWSLRMWWPPHLWV
jgi:hypothetical protein